VLVVETEPEVVEDPVLEPEVVEPVADDPEVVEECVEVAEDDPEVVTTDGPVVDTTDGPVVVTTEGPVVVTDTILVVVVPTAQAWYGPPQVTPAKSQKVGNDPQRLLPVKLARLIVLLRLSNVGGIDPSRRLPLNSRFSIPVKFPNVAGIVPVS